EAVPHEPCHQERAQDPADPKRDLHHIRLQTERFVRPAPEVLVMKRIAQGVLHEPLVRERRTPAEEERDEERNRRSEPPLARHAQYSSYSSARLSAFTSGTRMCSSSISSRRRPASFWSVRLAWSTLQLTCLATWTASMLSSVPREAGCPCFDAA